LNSKRKIVANLGFFLQITGLLLVLPIAIGLKTGEISVVSSLFATSFLSFAVGFVFNSFAERKELDERTCLWLMFATFTVLPLVLMVPFVWHNVFNSGNLVDLLTNAYFETVSGFTTTGFTFIANPESLPISLLFYRSLVEFIGGIGLVYIFLAFLYPNEGLHVFSETFGVEKLSQNLKKVLASIMLVYTVLAGLFTFIFYFTYSPNLITSSCIAMDVLTGGYQPKNFPAGIGLFQVSVLALMLLGSLNFHFHYNIFSLKLNNLFTPEIKFYLKIIVATTVAISILAFMNPFDSLFHVVSMASSTGISYINLAATSAAAKILFILIGLAGGCAFSMAGGIKMQRIQLLIHSVSKGNLRPTRQELKSILAMVTGFATMLLMLSLAFSTIGITLIDSIFEVGSALTTNGISMGATTVALPLSHKWLLIFAMITGRVEIATIFKAIKGNELLRTFRSLLKR
jgi:trk system potassium uptake protein TrkH